MWIDERIYDELKKMIPIASIDILVKYQNNILLLKRNNKPAKNIWFTPGGRVFINEDLDIAAKRILFAETGIKSCKFELCGVMNHIWPEIHNICIIYKIELNDNEYTNLKIILDNQHSDWRWFKEDSTDIHKYIKKMIKITSNIV